MNEIDSEKALLDSQSAGGAAEDPAAIFVLAPQGFIFHKLTSHPEFPGARTEKGGVQKDQRDELAEIGARRTDLAILLYEDSEEGCRETTAMSADISVDAGSR